MQTQKGKQTGLWPVMDPWESCDNAVGHTTAAPLVLFLYNGKQLAQCFWGRTFRVMAFYDSVVGCGYE